MFLCVEMLVFSIRSGFRELVILSEESAIFHGVDFCPGRLFYMLVLCVTFILRKYGLSLKRKYFNGMIAGVIVSVTVILSRVGDLNIFNNLFVICW